MQTNRIFAIGATRITVGLSAIVKVSSLANQGSGAFKIFSGGGTLEIVPFPVALSGSSAAGWGIGYPIGANEIITVGGPAQFYLAATGATMVATYAPAFTAGMSFGV